jgi:hypothetical protein
LREAAVAVVVKVVVVLVLVIIVVCVGHFPVCGGGWWWYGSGVDAKSKPMDNAKSNSWSGHGERRVVICSKFISNSESHVDNRFRLSTTTTTIITTPHPAAKQPPQWPQMTTTTPPLDRETTGRVSVASDDKNRSERCQTRCLGLGMFFCFFYRVF